MLNNIVGALTIAVVNLILWIKLLDKKINFKDLRLYVGMVFMTVMLIVNFFAVNQVIKTITVLLIVIIALRIMFNLDLRSSLVMAVFTQLFYIISEVVVIIFVLIITNINKNTILVESFFGTIYANLIISFVVFIIIQLPFIKSIYKKILSLVKTQKMYNIAVVIVWIIALASITFNLIYYTNNLILLSCLGLLGLIVCLIFVIKHILIRNSYLNMYVKYNSSLEMLKSYEDILDKYKVSNHENKNQLLMIRNMLGKDKKNDVSRYIDEIVENEYKDDENLMMETSKIPSGGLRALIYSKLLYMKNNNINFNLKVDRKIRSIQLVDLEQNHILDICKIVGVFLDNSIEEVQSKQDGSVSIELYMLDDKLNISIANTFEGFIDLDKIDELKYTTKGNGHGYGLTLVKEIIEKNNRLKNVRMINDNVFIQILKIDI